MNFGVEKKLKMSSRSDSILVAICLALTCKEVSFTPQSTS